jgi:hypothetical protein
MLFNEHNNLSNLEWKEDPLTKKWTSKKKVIQVQNIKKN